MVLDKFGRSSSIKGSKGPPGERGIAGERGPPGEGFNRTADGDYNLKD